MQEFDCDGIWWLPENPSDKVAGRLHFSDDKGGGVSLTGHLGELGLNFSEKSVPIIIGLVWDCPLGNIVTLKSCRVRGIKVGLPGISREAYFADRLFFGSHLETEKDFQFSELSVVPSGLSSWASTFTGLKYNYLPTEGGNPGGIEMRWIRPEPIAGDILGGHVTLGLAAHFPMEHRNWSMREELRIQISLAQPQSVDDLNRNYVYPIQNLMTLATDKPNALIEFSVRRPNAKEDIHVLGARVYSNNAKATGLLRHHMLFSAEDVMGRTVELIGNWMEFSPRMSDVCNLYFGVLYKPESFVDTQFFHVFQALEVYQKLKRKSDGSDECNKNQFLFDLFCTGLP
jgi:hypothetical protein